MFGLVARLCGVLYGVWASLDFRTFGLELIDGSVWNCSCLGIGFKGLWAFRVGAACTAGVSGDHIQHGSMA